VTSGQEFIPYIQAIIYDCLQIVFHSKDQNLILEALSTIRSIAKFGNLRTDISLGDYRDFLALG